jgi:hypothetical protein
VNEVGIVGGRGGREECKEMDKERERKVEHKRANKLKIQRNGKSR